MSKSKGNVIYADDLARLFGVDAVRFFVLHEMPFDNDGQISWELVAERYNSELANVLGNLVSRTVAMIVKYFGGAVEKELAAEEAPDAEFKETIAGVAAKVLAKADSLHIADAITEIFTLFRRANKYIDETMPWALAKDESKKARLNDVLYNLSEAIQIGASLLDSFMPETSAKILAAFNGRGRSLDECGRFGLSETVAVTPAPALFARIDFKAREPEIEKICEAQKAAASAEKPTGGDAVASAGGLGAASADSVAASPASKVGKPAAEADREEIAEISIDDFAKVRLQVGEVVACERVPKSSKLLHETVRFGNETRSVVSGIAKHYTPEEMVGKKVVFVTNLKPVKLCGILSEGMILAAEDEDGTLSLVVSDKDCLKSGAAIR